MKFYFITDQYFGKTVELSPRVPETIQEDEDKTKKRICVSTSIIGAVSGTIQNLSIGAPAFVYITEIESNSRYLIQPTKQQVFDVDYTGEFWITKKAKFNLYKMIEITKKTKTLFNGVESYICEFKEIFNKLE